MRGFPVLGRRIGVAVGFVQNESAGIVGLLQQIEPRDARFLYAVTGILDRGLPKGIDVFRFDVDVNDKDHHRSLHRRIYRLPAPG